MAMAYLPEEEQDAQRVAGIVQDAGVQVLTIPGDLRDPAYCRDLVDRAVEGLGGLDIVVNNGGKQIFNEDLTDLSDEQFDDTFKTNVYAMFWITKAATAPPSAGLDDHQHHVDPGVLALADPRRLRLDEGDHQRVHEGPCAAARAEGHPRQRGRAGADLDAAAGHRRSAAREDRRVRRGHPARPHGPASRARPRVRLPRVGGVELRRRRDAQRQRRHAHALSHYNRLTESLEDLAERMDHRLSCGGACPWASAKARWARPGTRPETDPAGDSKGSTALQASVKLVTPGSGNTARHRWPSRRPPLPDADVHLGEG